MTRHLIRLLWHRKRHNALIAFEVLVSFLVLLTVVAAGGWYADNWRRPLGYDWHDVWAVDVSGHDGDREWTAADGERVTQLIASARALPEVEAASGMFPLPWSDSHEVYGGDVNGRQVRYYVAETDDALPAVLKLPLVKGRWFGPEDDAAGEEERLVVDEQLAHKVFGDRDPVGQLILDDATQESPGRHPRRVVGVIAAYRQDGEYGAAEPFAFRRNDVARRGFRLRGLAVRVRPGTPAAFQETLARKLGAVARPWTVTVETLGERREGANRLRLAPIAAGAVVGGFLMLMVALGLTGVVWQSVTQRRAELGLRRALGATAGEIRAQVVGEVLVLAGGAVLVGIALAVQLPILGVLAPLRPAVYAASLLAAAAVILLLATVSALYPGQLATRMSPSAALREE